MIKQVFKYRKLHIIIGGDTYCINIPFYGNNTYIAMDPNGHIYSYDDRPVFDKSLNHYIVTEDGSYDLVAIYEGDTSKICGNIIAIIDKQYEYSFMES